MTVDLTELFASPMGEALRAAIILVAFGLAAWVLRLLIRLILRRVTRRSPNALAPTALRAIRGPATLFVVLQGLPLALVSLSYLAEWRDELVVGWSVVVVLLVSHGAARLTGSLMGWYARVVAPATQTSFDDKVIPILGRALLVSIYGIGVLVILERLGYSISPLLGGLGITGLAVAMALQPTLSNFFAGTYVITDGAINAGDYIELEGGPTGYVVEVGWRSTKVRNWMNNLVIIPNSKLADSIVTNYYAPDAKMNVIVYCGVSYDSDLEHVERTSLEVMREVLATCPGAVQDVEPFFGFDTFGDSNITFWVFVQAKDRFGSFIVQHEIVKALHARFKTEGIEINYPVRKLVYTDGDDPRSPAE
jgi:small-conductance mechanosensitive channel